MSADDRMGRDRDNMPVAEAEWQCLPRNLDILERMAAAGSAMPSVRT